MIHSVKSLLCQEITQRLIYATGLVLWTLISWDQITGNSYLSTSAGLSYATVYLVPATILILQIGLNNRILWGFIFGVMSVFILIAISVVIADAIERSGNHVKAIDWDVLDLLILLASFAILIGVDILIFSIRPKRLY